MSTIAGRYGADKAVLKEADAETLRDCLEVVKLAGLLENPLVMALAVRAYRKGKARGERECSLAHSSR